MQLVENNMEKLQLQEAVKREVERQLKQYRQDWGFTDRKLTDTPTDAYAVVPRKYVTNNGAVANRPVSSVAVVGQPYLATDTGIPMTYTVQGWRNGAGSIVALNS